MIVRTTHFFSKEQVRGQFLKDTWVLVFMTHFFSRNKGAVPERHNHACL